MHSARRIAIALTLSAAAQAALAQTTATVDVHGKPALPRATLQEACPHASAELPDALAATAQDVAAPGLVRVRFEIDGGRLHELKAEGGTPRQARAVARAVRSLGCSNGSAGRQVVQFQVRFLDPFARPAGQAVALLEASPR